MFVKLKWKCYKTQKQKFFGTKQGLNLDLTLLCRRNELDSVDTTSLINVHAGLKVLFANLL